ncbi:OB-fold nucleic acid binding domain-containing protein [Kitasatospora sp. NBC_01250]|uniref:OB-fold nucleic acid binding domain-containing protein n=1 Tax=unclassified Kitasatospora TaxID=2633591 RepID=UPI002E11D096|nr:MULTISPECIES: OB-fold nucleic acid binding domain-containing protein [unclassified Kitasatospora]WSJ68076.1 OB-fold nucleic acid binding domain-containing protein [Kitasatospora sp. NBC_01302]
MSDSRRTSRTSDNDGALARPAGQSLVRRVVARLSASSTDLHAEQLGEAIPRAGAMPIAETRDRELVCVVGTLRSVTLRPVGGVPALEADLWDGTGEVVVIWLGRREIPGIHPGRTLRVRGRLSTARGRRAIYNPAYELRTPGPS